MRWLLLATVLATFALSGCRAGHAAPAAPATAPSGDADRTATVAADSAAAPPSAASAEAPAPIPGDGGTPAAAAPTAPPPASRGLPPPAFAAAAALVMDEVSGAILYDRDGARRLPPASLTKIATAVVAIEAGGLDDEIEVDTDPDRYWLEDGTAMGLRAGDRFVVRDLLYGLLLASGNDAADALAEEAAGDASAFVARMNALARRLGLQDTHFTDPTGLGGPDHYSSAHDLALLARYAMSFADFRAVVSAETYTTRGSREISLYNLNPLLNYTPGVDGVKTGYTEEAGKTFVASAMRDGHRVYLVMLNAPNRALDAIAVLERVFSNFRWPG